VLLEAQLSQLAAAISSQETLISTLQCNEAEARSMGALYLVGQLQMVVLLCYCYVLYSTCVVLL
jgi:hypothetical protein